MIKHAHKPKKTGHFRPYLVVASLTLGVCIPAYSQDNDEDEIFELNPFVVDGSGDIGYESTSTTSVTSLNQNLKDLPMGVEVFNQQFLDDIAASDILDVLEYATGAQLDNEDQNDRSINFRGMTSRFARRNQFVWYNPADGFSMGRAEVIRGPQSLLYGQAEPGGLINTTSKQAIFGSKKGSAQIRLDDWGTKRAVLDQNYGADNIAFRFAGVRQDRESWKDLFQEELKGLYLAGKWRFLNESTTLRFEFEDASKDADPRTTNMNNIEVDGVNIRATRAFDADGNFVLDTIPELTRENIGTWSGTDNRFLREWQSKSLYLESSPTEWLSIQAAVNRQDQSQYQPYVTDTTNILRVDDNQAGSIADSLTGETLDVGEYYVRARRQYTDNGNTVDTARVNTTITFNAAGEHQLVNIAERRDDYFFLYRYQERKNNGAETGGSRRGFINFGLANGNNYSFDDVPVPLNSDGDPDFIWKRQVTLENEEHTDALVSALLSKWSFNGEESRLTTLIGYRSDDFSKTNLVSGNIEDADEIPSTSFGATYELTDEFSIYANKSESFKAPGATRRDPDFNSLSSAIGEGQEFGLKFDLFEKKVSGLASYYKSEFEGDQVRLANTPRDNIDPSGLNGRVGGNAQWVGLDTHSEGYELQFRTNLKKGWTGSFGYAYIDATVLNPFSFQANFNDSYLVDANNNPVDIDGNPIMVDDTTLTAANLMDYLEINEVNGAITNHEELGLVGSGVTGLKTFQYNGQATPIIVVTEAGRKLSNYAQHQINLVTNYRVQDGRFKGVSFGGALRWRVNNYAGYDGDGNLQLNPDYTTVDLFFGYRKKLEKHTWDTRINLKNALDEDYYRGSYLGVWGNPRQLMWTNTLSW